ncbi:MAG: hydrolase [Bacteroidia bacterium]|nr:hydrolase [Bacteroidia bacterium]NND24524.1 hydrolase [Flavobacteriaceae bacterium]MBT8277945.1 hydrolase [Bacteroidia bacterium]NNK60191.1 hydrolase [Flavobacteriaceae bacterium]NNL31637.1 hydrolase [Flavobacteriaceae bacterium]
MKKNIYLYLFVFALLLAIFMYVNSKNIVDKYETDISTLKEKDLENKSIITKLEDENLDLLYFNLEHNDDALSYLERDGYDTDEFIPFLKDELYSLNEVEGDHPMVPYASMSGNKMLINKIRLLNHKWIIADFSDGEYWGEMLLTYEITENKELKFKLVESLLYPPQ